MTCPDIRALLFEDLPETEKESMRKHLAGCGACHLEAERLKATTLALRSVPDEEPLVRIRFVSDSVFEPSWWQRLNPFRSAGLLAHAGLAIPTLAAAAILIAMQLGHYGKPSTLPAMDQTAFEKRVQQSVDARLNVAVAQAVHEVEARQDVKFQGMFATYRKQQQQDQEKLVQQVEAAWRYEDQLKTRALYAALEKPASSAGQ
jgi:hypothetical protein